MNRQMRRRKQRGSGTAAAAAVLATMLGGLNAAAESKLDGRGLRYHRDGDTRAARSRALDRAKERRERKAAFRARQAGHR